MLAVRFMPLICSPRAEEDAASLLSVQSSSRHRDVPAAIRSSLKIGVSDLSLLSARPSALLDPHEGRRRRRRINTLDCLCHAGGDADGGGGEREEEGGAAAALAGGAGQAEGGDDGAAETREASAESGSLNTRQTLHNK